MFLGVDEDFDPLGKIHPKIQNAPNPYKQRPCEARHHRNVALARYPLAIPFFRPQRKISQPSIQSSTLPLRPKVNRKL